MRNEPPKINWERLRNLRDRFLSDVSIPEPYWTSNKMLQDYDITLGERIGWKWDAVIAELKARGWRPPSPFLVDLGCGTGVAARRMVKAFPGAFQQVVLWDHSPAAIAYAKQKLRHEAPGVKVISAKTHPEARGVVVISHVLTELEDGTAADWMERLGTAQSILWVEPGTYEMSRLLIEVREVLREEFTVRAPCTHQAACGLLSEENRNHWCHHFAPAPPGAHQDSFWGHFRREMNLDVGPLAYSFLVLDRSGDPQEAELTRLLGTCMRFPKFLRVLGCREEGVRELVASRKADIYRSLKENRTPAVYRFDLKKNRIQSGEWRGGHGTDH